MIELDPDYAGAYNNLAWYLHLSGNSRKALIIIEKGIKIDPNYPILYVTSGEIKLGINDSGEIQGGLGLNDNLGACNDWKKVLSIKIDNQYKKMASDYLSKYCNINNKKEKVNRENEKRKARNRANAERDRKAKLNSKNNSKPSYNKIQTKIYSNGSYKGGLIDGKKNGEGVLTYYSGEVYNGDWVNDKRNGKGKNIWKSGNIYEGDWINGERTGTGKYIWKSGAIYEGYFIKGKRTGRGKYTKKDGFFSVGIWLDNKLVSEDELSINLTTSPAQSKFDEKWRWDCKDGVRYTIYVNQLLKGRFFNSSRSNSNIRLELNPGDKVMISRNRWCSSITKKHREKYENKNYDSFIVEENMKYYNINVLK